MSHQNYFQKFAWADRAYISLVFCVVLEEEWSSSRTRWQPRPFMDRNV